MSIYSDIQNVATSVLNEFNQDGIFLIHKTVDNTVPDEPVITEKRYSLRGVAKGFSHSFKDDSFVAGADASVTTSVIKGIEPSINDELELNGTRCAIIDFEPVPRAGVQCVWKFKVKK